MAKVSFLLLVLCGLASLSFAEQTTYGGKPAPAKYEAPAVEEKQPTKPEYKKMEEKEKKYEAPAVYEEKKDKSPAKPEYKKMEDKDEEKKPMKPYQQVEDDGKKKYKRSADDQTEEPTNDTGKVPKIKANVVSIKKVNQLRDAVMQDILADPILGLGFRYRRYPYFGFGYRRYPYFGFGYRRYFPYYGFGYRRFGYPFFFDSSRKLPSVPEGSTSADAAELDSENDDDSEEFDAIAAPQRKWWNDVDDDQFMDAPPQGRWWSPEELDETTDLLPPRRTCSIRNGRRICLPRQA